MVQYRHQLRTAVQATDRKRYHLVNLLMSDVSLGPLTRGPLLEYDGSRFSIDGTESIMAIISKQATGGYLRLVNQSEMRVTKMNRGEYSSRTNR